MGMLEKISMYSELWQKEVLEKKEAKKNKLKRDSKGKPIINLTPLEETVVHTKTQEEYNTLMQVYECGGWKWDGGELPTSLNFWSKKYKGETCIEAGYNDFTNEWEKFGWDGRDWFLLEEYKILSTQEFYKKQKITKTMINEIKDYFENKK